MSFLSLTPKSEVLSSGTSPVQPTDMSLLLLIIALRTAPPNPGPKVGSKPWRKFRLPVLTLALDADGEGKSGMPCPPVPRE